MKAVLTEFRRRTWDHVTPRYVLDRMRLAVRTTLRPEEPWLTGDSIDILREWIRPGDRGFEWGSGRSTVWFAEQGARLDSIETDPAWHERVNGWLDERCLSDRAVCHMLDIDTAGVAARNRYSSAISNVADVSLDFCLVDGFSSYRDSCVLAAIPKIRPGGLLIVDNANIYLPVARPSRAPNSRASGDGYQSSEWEQVDRIVRDWRRIWTTNGVTDTAMWIRPC